MMLIIPSPDGKECVDWLVENTNKSFCFKQLLELGQLICSAGISDVYKPIKQGKEIQKWITKNKEWVFFYYFELYTFCKRSDIDMKKETMERIDEISTDLFCNCKLKGTKSKVMPKVVDIYPIKYDLETAIWRYSKEYSSDYPTNSELPIEECCEQYRKYLEWKFSV